MYPGEMPHSKLNSFSLLLASLVAILSSNCTKSNECPVTTGGVLARGGTPGCVYGGASYGQTGCGGAGGGASGSTAVTCNSVLFDNGNTAACTKPTDTSVFTLLSTSTVTSLSLWTNTTTSGKTVSYTLLGPTGNTLSSGLTTKGGCDPYQTNWCAFVVTMNITLPPGTYTVKSSAVATCANSGSNNVGMVSVRGCAGSGSGLGGAGGSGSGGNTGCIYGGDSYGQPGCGGVGGGTGGSTAVGTCSGVLFDNGNTAACTNPTDTSVFTLSSASTVTSLRLWTNTNISGQTVTYTLVGPTGTTLSSGPTTKGGCDPYQTNWCEFMVTMNMTLPAGTYTVKSSAMATCANSGSNNVGQVTVKGCPTSAPPPDAGASDTPVATCSGVLFDNGNTAACTNPTDTSVFTLSSASTVTSLRLWTNTTISGQTVTYTLLGPTGSTLATGPTTKGGCDPYQTNWCEFMVTMSMTLPAGTYTVKSSAMATCANSGSNNVGQVTVKGCPTSSPPPDAGASDTPVATCSGVLFDNGNIYACTNPTDTSVFTLSSASTVTSLRLWTNTNISGQTVTYTLLGPTGSTLAAGPTTKGGCDTYQTNWCEFMVTMNMTLPAGTYTVKSSAMATCANSLSNNVGQVTVKGCASASPSSDAGVDRGPVDAGPTYFTVSTPPTGIAAPTGAKVNAVKTTTNFGVGGLFWKDGRLFSASNLGGPIVSVMPGETGTLWANVPTLTGGNPSWRHGVPLTGGNILLAIDYYGGPTGLHEITPAGGDTAWTLASGHSGIGDIVALASGGWIFSDFESYNIFKLTAQNVAETALIPAGGATYTPACLAYDGSTDTLYFVNMNDLGGEPWFGGDGAIYKMTTLTANAPTLVAKASTGSRFAGLAIGLGGLFPAGLYAADAINSRIVRVESAGTLTPIVVGVPTPGEMRIDPNSKGMALISADQIIFVLP